MTLPAFFTTSLSVGTHSVTFRGDYDLNINFQSHDDTYYAIPECWNNDTTKELQVIP